MKTTRSAFITNSRVAATPPFEPTTPTQPGWVFRDRALAGDGGGNRDIERLDECLECLFTARQDDTTPDDHDRKLGRQNGVERGLDLLWIGACGVSGEAAMGGVAPDRIRIGGAALDIDGKTEMGGAGAARGHLAKGAPHHIRHRIGMIDHGVELGERPHQPFLVKLGQGVMTACTCADIGGDRQDRHRAFIGLDQYLGGCRWHRHPTALRTHPPGH